MLKKIIVSLSVVLFLASAALAQKVYTPEKGSKERTAILDALRIPVEKELKQKVQFAVNDFTISGNWAFVSGEPQNMDGGQPDYSKTIYKDEVAEGMFDNNFFALLKKVGGKWKIITHAVGCTDVCYIGWDKAYKAPKAIFPYTED